MKIDFRTDSEAVVRYVVTHGDTEEPIENVAWADDEAGEYAVFVMGRRTLSHSPDADLRIKEADGSFKVKEYRGHIIIYDLLSSPWKQDVLTLLDDPDIQSRLVHIMAQALAEGIARAKG